MKTSIRRIMVGTAAVAASAMVIGTVAPAGAGTTVTDFAFKAWSFGTLADTDQVGVTSGPTAYSWLGCTRLTGVEHSRSAAAVEPPEGLMIGAVNTSTKSYRNLNPDDATPDTVAGVRTTNRVAEVTIGDPAGVHLTIKGLVSAGYAWHDKATNKLRAKAAFNSTDIAASLPEEMAPLEDILNEVDYNLKDLINTILAEPNDEIEIPGLALIRVGKTVIKEGSSYAFANVHALRIRLYGPNATNDAGNADSDDAQVVVGRSHARIYRGAISGVMGGNAYGLKATALDNIAKIGPIVERSLQCKGTNGVVKESYTAAVNPGEADAVALEGVGAQAYGIQKDNGAIVAWTQGKVAELNLGGDSLIITGIVGRARMGMSKNGAFYPSIKGSTVGSITADGEPQEFPDQGAFEIPGVAKIETNVVTKRKNFIEVIAVRVTLLDGSGAVIDLGKASAWVRPF